MSFTIKLQQTEYERLHGSKYELKVTNDATGQSAIGSCTDATLSEKIKYLKESIS